MKQNWAIGWLLVIALLGVIVYTYWGLWDTFYQQDEWQELGLNFIESTGQTLQRHYNMLQLVLGEGRVLSRLLYRFFYLSFPFAIAPIAGFSLILHAVNAGLLWRLVRRLNQPPLVAAVAALFYAVNATAHEAVTWAAASLGTLPAVTLVLATMLTYLNFLQTNKRQWLYLALALLVISLLFKEIGIFLVVFLPFWYWLTARQLRQTLVANRPFLIIGLIVIAARIISLLTQTAGPVGTITQGGADFLPKTLLHLLTYPLEITFQAIVPPSLTYWMAEAIARPIMPPDIDIAKLLMFAQGQMATIISILGSLVLIGLTLFLARKDSPANRHFLFVGLGLVVTSVLPYIVIDKGAAYFDSRYYTVAALGASLIVSYMLSKVWQSNWLIRTPVVIVAFLLVVTSMRDIRQFINRQLEVAADRRTILETIKTDYPTIDQKSIFYIAGDRDFHVPDHKVPFQQGFGYSLLVWYYPTGQVPAALIRDNFLWEMGKQGYREVNGLGFGYFSRLDTLRATLTEQQLDPTVVRGFYWDSKAKRLMNQTEETQLLLQRS